MFCGWQARNKSDSDIWLEINRWLEIDKRPEISKIRKARKPREAPDKIMPDFAGLLFDEKVYLHLSFILQMAGGERAGLPIKI